MVRKLTSLTIVACAAVFCAALSAAEADETEFHAHHYSKNLATNSAKGTGNATLKKGDRFISADEIEIDYTTNRAIANGNVYIREKGVEVWCRHASYNLQGEDAVLEDATLQAQQVVMTGAVVRRHTLKHFVIERGSYSNCNLEAAHSKDIPRCSLDWKISGSTLDITVEGYATVTDAILYARDLPVFFSPLFVFPVKSERQSGFLWPKFLATGSLGSGFTPPFFIALAPWHDLTIYPTYFGTAGYHFGFEYRYIYSAGKRGYANLYLVQRRFGSDPNNPLVPDGPKRLGFLGEGAVVAANTYNLGGRATSRQALRLVSHPYFTKDYDFDFPGYADQGYLRSIAQVTLPGDSNLLAGHIQYNQSVLLSLDRGVDQGAVTELPTLFASHTNTPLLSSLVSYEVDARFSNFYRPMGYDPVSPAPVLPTTKTPGPAPDNADPSGTFQPYSYIRTGRRLQVEPRLVGNVPMPAGFQVQPVLRAGGLFYHFDFPTSSTAARAYVDWEVPFSMYLNRTFETGIAGFEKVSHVIQPRIVYGASIYQTDEPSHPFFYRDLKVGPISLANPRFDVTDQLYPFEYVRFELLNRFRRKSGSSIARFFRLDISEQYNSRLSPADPRFSRRLGPVELLAELNIGRVSAQIQANYPLQLTDTFNGVPLPAPLRETDVSGSITYSAGPLDNITLGSLFRTRADPTLAVKTLTLGFKKSLPVALDLEGSVEYSFLPGSDVNGIRGYKIGLDLHHKPTSCWRLYFATGRDSYRNPFVMVDFRLYFGNPGEILKPL